MAKKPKHLSPESAERIARLHESAIHRSIAAEAIAITLLRVPVKGATDRLIATVAQATDSKGARDLFMREMATVQQELGPNVRSATVAARGHARTLALGQVSDELNEGLVAARSMFGVAQQPNVIRPIAAASTASADYATGVSVGNSIAVRWSNVAFAEFTTWKRDGGGPDGLARRLRAIPEGADGTLRRAAVTTTVDAFADEHRGALQASFETARELAGGGGPAGIYPAGGPPEPGLPEGWSKGFMDVFSAFLDRKTCPVCAKHDGEMVPRGSEFSGGIGRPPIHPWCRCIMVTVFVPEAYAKRLPGFELDYESLKEDVLEYMQDSKLQLQGKRHAVDYINEVLGTGGAFQRSSPEALTARMLARDYYDREAMPKAPRVKVR